MKVLIYNTLLVHIMGKDAQWYVDERIATPEKIGTGQR
jgi:hypothetical protein